MKSFPHLRFMSSVKYKGLSKPCILLVDFSPHIKEENLLHITDLDFGCLFSLLFLSE